MKLNINNLLAGVTFFISFIFLTGCTSILNEPVHSELAPENVLKTKKGLESTLAEAYAYSANMQAYQGQHEIKEEEMVTDILVQIGGGEERNANLLINFTFEPAQSVTGWIQYWYAIRNANLVIDNIDEADITTKEKDYLKAETKFVRAYAYYTLWKKYGPLPIRKSSEDPPELPRPSEEVFNEFLENELLDAIPNLPVPGNEPEYGRAHSEAARGLLTKFYLNTHQWKKAADLALEIINNGNYELYPDYNEMFALENEKNNEFIWVRQAITGETDARNTTTATAFPPRFFKALDGGIEGVTNQGWANYASNYKIRDEFYYSFDPDDERKNRILTLYVDNKGDTIDLLNNFVDNTRGIKYPPDPNALGENHGNDIPFLRYADILLSRAEALNEMSGPNQESIDLINEVRNRAGLIDINLTDFSLKSDLRDHILKERGWEFWYEAKRREDLIRMGKLIDFAQARGKTNASEKHNRYPIPQSAIDANPLLEQNPGY